MTEAASDDTQGATATAIPAHDRTLAALGRVFGEGVFTTSRFRDNLRLHVPSARLVELLRTLRDECGFAMLAELGCVDYLGYPGRSPSRARFEVHYVLLDLDTTERLVIKVEVPEAEAQLPTVVPLWIGANWMEREIFDMFGIRFDGHPDLRRILLPEEFTAHPLRKDYPLRGRGERHNFPRLTRGES